MKTCLLIISFFFFISIIEAKDVYYSDYNQFKYHENIVEASELVDVDIERRYKHYYEEIEKGGYYLDSNIKTDYPLINYFDKKVEPFSEWSSSVPSIIGNRLIEQKNFYVYRDMKLIRYIHLKDMMGGNNKLNIREIKIKSGLYPVSYSIICDKCSDNFEEYVTNGIINENNSFVETNGHLIIDLKGYFDMEYLTIEFNFYDDTFEEKRVNVFVTREITLDNIYMKNLTRMVFKHNNIEDNYLFTLGVNYFLFEKPEYEEIAISQTPIATKRTRSKWNETLYRYQDTLYLHYRLNKVYTEGYHKEYLTLNKDETMYKDYYRVRTREKLEILKDIKITNYTDNIHDFITSTTQYEVEGKINYLKNGVYNINIKTPFIEVVKRVTVDIQFNDSLITKLDLEEYLNHEDIYKKLNEKNIELVEIKEMLKKYNLNQKTIKLEENLLSYPKENIEEILNLLQIQHEKLLLDNSKITPKDIAKTDISNLIYYLVITLILLIFIYIYKKSRTNKLASFVESV